MDHISHDMLAMLLDLAANVCKGQLFVHGYARSNSLKNKQDANPFTELPELPNQTKQTTLGLTSAIQWRLFSLAMWLVMLKPSRMLRAVINAGPTCGTDGLRTR